MGDWGFDRCQARWDNAIPEDRSDVFSDEDEDDPDEARDRLMDMED